MGETHDRKLGSNRRKLLTVRLRRYFEELKADLEADSEAFFQNAMAHAAERAPDAPLPRPQQRRG